MPRFPQSAPVGLNSVIRPLRSDGSLRSTPRSSHSPKMRISGKERPAAERWGGGAEVRKLFYIKLLSY